MRGAGRGDERTRRLCRGGEGEGDAGAGGGAAVDVETGAELGGAGVHVGKAEAGAVGFGGGETATVVVNEKTELVVGGFEADDDGGRGAVAQGVADGLANDLEQFDGLRGGELAGGGVVDLVVEFHVAIGGKVFGEGAEGGGEFGGGEIFGGEAGDVGTDFADAAVEAFASPKDAAFGFGGIGGDEGAGGFEGETGGVEGLDDAVVEVATEADFFLKGAIEELLIEEGVGFGALAVVAFVGELERLGDGRFGEFGEGADFGAGDAEGCAGVGGAGAADGEAGEEARGENEGGERERKGETLGEFGEAGGGVVHPALVATGGAGGEEEAGERDENEEEGEAEDAREGVHTARVRMGRRVEGSKGLREEPLAGARSRGAEQNFRHLERARIR